MDGKQIKQRMDTSSEVFLDNLTGVRVGRASPRIIEGIMVNAYGSEVPINQVSSISSIDAVTLSVQVWDTNHADAVDKAIRSSDLNLNPVKEGNVLRIPFPKLSQERRVEYVKLCSNYLEQSKVALRNIRRDEIEKLKKLEKAGDISKDDLFSDQEAVQKMLDEYISDHDKFFEKKKDEIMSV
ncbi:MAG: ribosome recycling factor [Rickettsiales bacterium]|jgi:ribosome recycling factor|nr:ribosome recycling factor [Rickettsiales bacterium]